MSFTDPIGDMLTRIRNASSARHEKCLVPASRLKIRIAEVLREEGFIKDFMVHQDSVQGAISSASLLPVSAARVAVTLRSNASRICAREPASA